MLQAHRQQRPHPIAVLLTDVVMPEMNDCQLADRPDLKVLYRSGCAGDVMAAHQVLAPGLLLLD